MTALRFAFRLSCIGLCLIYGAAEMFFIFPFYTPRRKLRAIQICSPLTVHRSPFTAY